MKSKSHSGYMGLCVVILLGISCAAFAEEKSQAKAGQESAKEEGADFRCEKMRKATLQDLKAKLVSNCNLNKPFSFAAENIAVDSSYTYCCTLK